MATCTHTPAPGPQVYTLELHIVKVVLGDRGSYRLEVKAKDVCDSCGFSIDVEGALAGVATKGCGMGGRLSQPNVGRAYRWGLRWAQVFGGTSTDSGVRVFKIVEAPIGLEWDEV